MSSTASMKAGDTGRILASTLRYRGGGVVDLTGCDVRLVMRKRSGGVAVLDGPAVVEGDPTEGYVTFSDWETTGAEVTATPGEYVGHWVVTDASDNVVTVPSGSFLALEVVESITVEA